MEDKQSYFESNFFFSVFVFGSRALDPSAEMFVRKQLDELNLDKARVYILSGGAEGPDTWSVQWATEHEFFSLVVRPDYKRGGRIAPIIRDQENAEKCTWGIGFWDGSSKGTIHTKKFLQKDGKPFFFWTLEKGIWTREIWFGNDQFKGELNKTSFLPGQIH